LEKTHLKLIDECNILKDRNRKLNYERFEINKNLDEMYNSQTLNYNYDILQLAIDNLEEENKALKNKLKSTTSSFFQNEKITHFQLCFISEITKKGDNYIKIKKYHTPDKYKKGKYL
jgi:hypothetical protein